MIVVADTSPLAYLVQIDIIECLPRLYQAILIPPTVAAELRHRSSPASSWIRTAPGWLQVVAPQILPVASDLDKGEEEAIALAIEHPGSILMIDERKGREAAKSAGITVAGTLAIILDCAKAGLCDGKVAVEKLRLTSFYMSPELYQRVLGQLP
jgi:predicted nucleic acid-binding protein